MSEQPNVQMVPIEKPEEGAPEPSWLRDLEGAEIVLYIPLAELPVIMGQLFEGQAIHCEHCGQKFALWPVSQFAQHIVSIHDDQNTVQQMRGMSMLAGSVSPESGAAFAQFAQMQLTSRVSVRRKAWRMGILARMVSHVVLQ